ncbi:MAG: type II toxin-antitoxin system VapC family toxin [Coriobacteriia bacterium]
MTLERAVIDSNVVLATLLEEPGTLAAESALALCGEWLAPDLFAAEAISVIAKKVRVGSIDSATGYVLLARLQDMPVMLTPARLLDRTSLDLSIELDHPAYDCFYLALAIQRECTLLTLDRKLAHRAVRAGFGDFVQLVGTKGQ